MKKVYESPVFLAEAYSFSSSIASCGQSVNNPQFVKVGDELCDTPHNGHKYGGQHGTSGSLAVNDITSGYLFNDGDATACTIDWDYQNDIVKVNGSPYGSFSQAFYGNNSSGGHRPGYHGVAFFS